MICDDAVRSERCYPLARLVPATGGSSVCIAHTMYAHVTDTVFVRLCTVWVGGILLALALRGGPKAGAWCVMSVWCRQ